MTGSYAISRLAARLAYQYVGTYIDKVGNGLNDPAKGDKMMMAHAQLDGAVNLSLPGRAEVVFQAINLNNEPFGYYVGADTRNFAQEGRGYFSTTRSTNEPGVIGGRPRPPVGAPNCAPAR